MRAPIDGPLPIRQLFASLKGGSSEAYEVLHDGVTYHCRGHAGIDIACPVGTPVHAMKAGSIQFYGPTWGFPDNGYGPLGLLAVVTLWTDEAHWYGHLSEATVPSGSTVAEGQQIALSGMTGTTTGPHVHVSIRPPTVDFANGFDGFIDWISRLYHDVYPLLDLSQV